MRSVLLAVASALIVVELAGAALSQGTPQRITTLAVDPKSLAVGYRATRLVGSTVINDTGELVGRVDDLIVTPADRVPYAVLSVGGFLGVGTRLVVVPTTALDVTNKRLVLHGATRASLILLPGFAYTY